MENKPSIKVLKEVRIERSNLTKKEKHILEAFLSATLEVKKLLKDILKELDNVNIMFYSVYNIPKNKGSKDDRLISLYNNFKEGLHIYQNKETKEYSILINPFKVVNNISKGDIRNISYPIKYYVKL